MDRNVTKLPIALDLSDRQILELLAEKTRVSRREVVRWALRFYALKGPWSKTKRDRVEAIGGLDIGSVGPSFEEAI